MIELILKIVGAFVGIYEFINIGYKMIKGKKVRDVLKSAEFKILIAACILTFCLFFPWSKIHYGDNRQKIVYVDSSLATKKAVAKEKVKKIDAPKPIPIKPVASHRNITVSKPSIEKKSYASQNDTTKNPLPASTLNQVPQTGKNNFNGGSGNFFGAPIHNGDIVSEPELTKEIENYLINGIEKAKKQFKTQSNDIELVLFTRSNASKLYSQAREFLIRSGYTIIGEGTVYGDASGIGFEKGINKVNVNVSVKFGRIN